MEVAVYTATTFSLCSSKQPNHCTSMSDCYLRVIQSPIHVPAKEQSSSMWPSKDLCLFSVGESVYLYDLGVFFMIDGSVKTSNAAYEV